MKDLFIEFEDFTKKLFTALGNVIHPSGRGERPYDFSFTRGTETTVVEVKLYRSQRTSSTNLRNASLQVAFARLSARASKAILVTNTIVDEATRNSLEHLTSVEIFDYNKLMTLTASDLDLRAELEEIIRQSYTFHNGPLPIAVPAASSSEGPLNTPLKDPAPGIKVTKGNDLCEKLRKIPSGRDDASTFEKACTEALQYVFADDFVSWTPQPISANGLHRYDLIARISSNDEFWLSLIQDFRTRYVIFEFKNYKESISQDQIYSTEKYLYPTAMRATAVIIARQGANSNAIVAASGALRESGKLILVLSLDQLYKMLVRKDFGYSASDIMANKLDEMLLKIER